MMPLVNIVPYKPYSFDQELHHFKNIIIILLTLVYVIQYIRFEVKP